MDNEVLIVSANQGLFLDRGDPGIERGSNAVDLQLKRTNPNNVARGKSSVILGGRDNRTEGFGCVAAGIGSVAGSSLGVGSLDEAIGYCNFAFATNGNAAVSGNSNFITGVRPRLEGSSSTEGNLVGGRDNYVGGSYNLVAGDNCKVSGGNTIAVGHDVIAGTLSGLSNPFTDHAAGNLNSIVVGGESAAMAGYTISQGFWAKSRLYGEYAQACGSFSATIGETPSGNALTSAVDRADAQFTRCVMGRRTTNATPALLVFAFPSITLDNYLLLANTTYLLDLKILARLDGGSGNAQYTYGRRLVLNRVAAGNPTIVSDVEMFTPVNPGTWIETPPALAIDNTDDALTITVTGVAATNINWLAVLEGLMVTG